MNELGERGLVIISSDGHAGALMADYRPYLDPHLHEEFDAFLVHWNAKGSRNFDAPALKQRIDQEFIDQWVEKMVADRAHRGVPGSGPPPQGAGARRRHGRDPVP